MVPARTIIVIWASLAILLLRETGAYRYRKILKEGERISNGQYLTVPDLIDNSSSLVPPWWAMQRDCNFVLYDQDGQPAWSSGTYQQGLSGSCYASVKDCNLLVYSGGLAIRNPVLWNSSSSNNGSSAAPSPPCYATLVETNGTPAGVLFDSSGRTAWSSKPIE